jgi:hypothetical protein
MRVIRNLAKTAKAGLAGGLLLLAGCAAPPLPGAAVPPGPVPIGEARIWFYRVPNPSLSRNAANVDLNGVRAATVLPGGPPVAVDVAPGPYHIAPESFGVDTNQSRDVNLAAGQTVYVKILDDPNRMSAGDLTEFRRDTFYAWLMPPPVALAEMRTSM